MAGFPRWPVMPLLTIGSHPSFPVLVVNPDHFFGPWTSIGFVKFPVAAEIGHRICDRILWLWIVTNFPVKSSPTLLDTTTASLSMLFHHYLFTCLHHHHLSSRFMAISLLITHPSLLTDCYVWLWGRREQRLFRAKISLSDAALPLEMPPLSQKIYFGKLLKLRNLAHEFFFSHLVIFLL